MRPWAGDEVVMLDHFLKVAYERSEADKKHDALVEDLMKLPDEELHKIARGEHKLAMLSLKAGDGGACWLDQFKGTPLYAQAVSLEEEDLKLEIEQTQRRAAERAQMDSRSDIWDARDALCVKKRLLELELRKSELAQETGGAEGLEEHMEPDGDEGVDPEMPPDNDGDEEKEAAVNELAAARLRKIAEQMRKTANKGTGYWQDEISDAAMSAPQVQLSPAAMQMAQGDVRRSIGSSIADQQAFAQNLKDHPIGARVKPALVGGGLGAGLGAAVGAVHGGAGKGALIGAGLGAGGLLAALGGPGKHQAILKEMQGASDSLNDEQLAAALNQAATEKYKSAMLLAADEAGRDFAKSASAAGIGAGGLATAGLAGKAMS